jgi:tripartite-type tricarboxylate transporter receptor subunit TctC
MGARGENLWRQAELTGPAMPGLDPEKACPGLDPGYAAVFGRDHVQIKKLSRRQFAQLAAATAAVPAFPSMAMAQTYPTRPVRFVISFPQGGPNDILGRLAAGWLSQRLGQPFEVENRPGRSGNTGTEIVVRAAADGYTVLLCGPANAISGSLYANLGFNFLRDMTPVAGITREALVMVVHPSVPARTVPEFIAYAKANLDTLKMASTGNGSSPHVTGELFKLMTGLPLQVVHYTNPQID